MARAPAPPARGSGAAPAGPPRPPAAPPPPAARAAAAPPPTPACGRRAQATHAARARAKQSSDRWHRPPAPVPPPTDAAHLRLKHSSRTQSMESKGKGRGMCCPCCPTLASTLPGARLALLPRRRQLLLGRAHARVRLPALVRQLLVHDGDLRAVPRRRPSQAGVTRRDRACAFPRPGAQSERQEPGAATCTVCRAARKRSRGPERNTT